MKMKQKFPIEGSAIGASAGATLCIVTGLTMPIAATIIVVGMGGAGWFLGRKVADEKGERANEYFNEGETFYDAKKYSEALESYLQSIKQNPEHVKALYKLGWLFQYGQGVDVDANRASEYYKKAIQEGHFESKKQHLIIENSELTTPDQWCDLGENYYNGQNGKRKDYSCARACYETAVAIYLEQSFFSKWRGLYVQEYTRTLYLLGWLYQYGQGVDTDLTKAKEYYKKAAEMSHYESIKQLTTLENPTLKTAEQWFKLGKDYSDAQDKTHNYLYARACYEQAVKLDPKHVEALFNLGWLFHYGKGVEADLTKAKEYYERVIQKNKNHYETKKHLLILNNPTLTIEQWLNFGEDYCRGRNGKKQNYPYARACYEKTTSLYLEQSFFSKWRGLYVQEYTRALFLLGQLYQYGQGINTDLIKAAEYYKKAAEMSHYESIKQLITLENPTLKTAEQWFKLGKDYFDAQGKTNYLYVRACYEQAVKLDPKHVEALFNLGWLFHYGKGVETDLTKAKEYYERVIQKNKNHYEAKKHLFILNNSNLTTADQWLQFGENFFRSSNNKSDDYFRAVICCEQVIKLDSKHAYAFFILGSIYHHGGYGITKDLQLAKIWYQKAVDNDYEDAKEKLSAVQQELTQSVLLKGKKFTKSQEWHELGESYDRQEPQGDYLCAMVCYQESLKFGLYSETFYRLGILYHLGKGVTKNLSVALMYYQKAVDLGHEDAKNKLKEAQQENINLQASSEYQRIKTFLSWASLLWAPSYVEKLSNLLLPPAFNWVAEKTGLTPLVMIGQKLSIGVSAVMHPMGPIGYTAKYVAENAVGYIFQASDLHESIKKIEINSPEAKALLLLSADYLSDYAKNSIMEVINSNQTLNNSKEIKPEASKKDDSSEEELIIDESKAKSLRDKIIEDISKRKPSNVDLLIVTPNHRKLINPASFFQHHKWPKLKEIPIEKLLAKELDAIISPRDAYQLVHAFRNGKYRHPHEHIAKHLPNLESMAKREIDGWLMEIYKDKNTGKLIVVWECTDTLDRSHIATNFSERFGTKRGIKMKKEMKETLKHWESKLGKIDCFLGYSRGGTFANQCFPEYDVYRITFSAPNVEAGPKNVNFAFANDNVVFNNGGLLGWLSFNSNRENYTFVGEEGGHTISKNDYGSFMKKGVTWSEIFKLFGIEEPAEESTEKPTEESTSNLSA